MSPILNNGDIVIFKKVMVTDFTPEKDTIIIFRNPLDQKEILVKKIHKVSPNGVEVRGINQENSLDSRKFGYVSKINIIGLVENRFNN